MPGIFLGNDDISAIYVGSTPVKEVYVGAVKVWPVGPPGKVNPIQYVDTGYLALTPRVTNNVNLGPAAADRRILLALISDSSSASGGVNGVTIAGVGATLLASQNTSIRRTYWYMAHIPTGTTGTISINNTGHNMTLQYGVYALTEGVPSLIDSGNTTSNFISGQVQAVDDFVLAVGICGNLTGTPTLASNPVGLSRNTTCSGTAGGGLKMLSGRHRTDAATSGGTVTFGWTGSVEIASGTAITLRFA